MATVTTKLDKKILDVLDRCDHRGITASTIAETVKAKQPAVRGALTRLVNAGRVTPLRVASSAPLFYVLSQWEKADRAKRPLSPRAKAEVAIESLRREANRATRVISTAFERIGRSADHWPCDFHDFGPGMLRAVELRRLLHNALADMLASQSTDTDDVETALAWHVDHCRSFVETAEIDPDRSEFARAIHGERVNAHRGAQHAIFAALFRVRELSNDTNTTRTNAES